MQGDMCVWIVERMPLIPGFGVGISRNSCRACLELRLLPLPANRNGDELLRAYGLAI